MANLQGHWRKALIFFTPFVFVILYVRIENIDVTQMPKVGLSAISAHRQLTGHESEINQNASSNVSIDGRGLQTSYPDPIVPDNWQTVVPGKIFVYSAYLDPWTLNETVIRILGTMPDAEMNNENRTKLFCKLWISKNNKHEARVLESPVTMFTQLLRYRSTIYREVEYTCRFSTNPTNLTNSVIQLVTDYNEQAITNAMKVHDNFRKGRQINYTVCLERPIFGSISSDWFVEWFELNLMFGAEKIVIHNMSMPRHLDPYVNYYKKLGLLEVIPYFLPLPEMEYSMKYVHANLQVLMMYDCLYRLQKYSKYIVFVDLDELIVPRWPTDRTWSDMIARLNCSPPTHSYGARQLAFPSIELPKGSLRTMETLERNGDILSYRTRSKYIADTFIVRRIRIHSAANTGGGLPCVMPIEVGALHHYRRWKVDKITRDVVMLKYRTELLRRIRVTMERVAQH